MKTAILGITGMLGGAMARKFKFAGIDFDGFSRPAFDAESPNLSLLAGYDYVINCIGIIKPYIHDDNANEVLRAIRVNSEFPYALAKLDSKVIQIATDCVWDGARGNYTETDSHNALDVYGKTKSLGEVRSDNFLNLRCSIIGPEQQNFCSLLEWFLHQPKNANLKGFQNHLWNGLTTDAFANICIGIIANNAWFNGTQHIVPADIMTKAQMLHTFADCFNRRDIHISDTDAPTPINRTLATNNAARNKDLWRFGGYSSIPTIRQMIQQIQR